jgi:hypothetical protein
MADQTLQQFFSGVLLTELVRSEAVKSGIPDVLPAQTRTTRSGQNPVGTQVQWHEITGNRKTALQVAMNSPAKAVDTPGVTRRFATAIGTKEELVIDHELIQALMSNIPLYQERAKQELVNRVRQFRTRADNLEIAARASVFANGAIYFDKSGNLLPTSTGSFAPLSPAFNVPTANKLTKDGAGSTYNIGDWSSASTDIFGNLRTLRNANIKANGYQLNTILYGQSVPSYILQNTTAKAYLQFNPAYNNTLMTTNEIPNGFAGWNWAPVSSMFFDDQNGTTQAWFSDKYLGVMPTFTTDWYDYFECGALVPRNVVSAGWVPNLDNLNALLDIVYGLWSYGEFCATSGVVALKQYVGHHFLPVVKVPGTFYYGTCA